MGRHGEEDGDIGRVAAGLGCVRVGVPLGGVQPGPPRGVGKGVQKEAFGKAEPTWFCGDVSPSSK